MMKCRPGYEHLNEPLHILVTSQLPVETIDARLGQARKILEDFLKHMISGLMPSSSAQNIRGSWSRSSGRSVKNRLKVFLPINHILEIISRVECISSDSLLQFDFVESLCSNGDALKRIQKSSGCSTLIRGRESMEDPVEEERLRSEPELHLNENLHVVVLAKEELPVEIINAHLNQACDMIKDSIKPTALKSSGEVWLLSNFDSQEDIAYSNDPQINTIKVDDDLKLLYQETKLHNMLDIKKELQKNGMKPSTNTAKRRATSQMLGISQKPRTKVKK